MFDSHCHLTDGKFDGDRDAVIGRAWQAGLTGIVTIASDPADASAALELARTDQRIRCTAGIHPHVAEHADDAAFERILQLTGEREVVAIGEAGLDFHYDNSPRDVQRAVFERQLLMASETDLPIIVHSRSADDDTAAMIRASAGVRGVLHCFAGGRGLFDTAMTAGWYISFAGLITFRKFDNQALLRATPADRLLLETDSPYLAPVPHRGRRNEPSFIVQTAQAAATIRGAELDAIAAATTANARSFYRLDVPGLRS